MKTVCLVSSLCLLSQVGLASMKGEKEGFFLDLADQSANSTPKLSARESSQGSINRDLVDKEVLRRFEELSKLTQVFAGFDGLPNPEFYDLPFKGDMSQRIKQIVAKHNDVRSEKKNEICKAFGLRVPTEAEIENRSGSSNLEPFLGSSGEVLQQVSDDEGKIEEEIVEEVSSTQGSSLCFDDVLRKKSQSLSEKDPLRELFIVYEKFTRDSFELQNQELNELHDPMKDRFSNILPPKKTRVLLPSRSYINANYMVGKRFIATQSPTAMTTGDFWEMVFESESPLIVNLTNAEDLKGSRKKKPSTMVYWPEAPALGQDVMITSSGYIVKWVSEGQFAEAKSEGKSEEKIDVKEAEWTYRKISVTSPSGVSREVLQLHFHHWPDGNVPDDDKWKKFVKEFRVHTKTNRPIIIHCSAGVGRTATLIGTVLIEEKKEQSSQSMTRDEVDRMILDMRVDRGYWAVQTPPQLQLLYKQLN